MIRFTQTLLIIFSILLLNFACSPRKSEEAKGRETELSGDEPYEISTLDAQDISYDPSDTVVNISEDKIPARLQDHLRVVVDAYITLGEALALENEETAKSEANGLVQIFERHEQENLEMEPEVRALYTNSAHIIRESAQTIVNSDDLREMISTYSAMAPAAYKSAKMTDFGSQNLYYQFSPDLFDGLGAYWLSRTNESTDPSPYAALNNSASSQIVATIQ